MGLTHYHTASKHRSWVHACLRWPGSKGRFKCSGPVVLKPVHVLAASEPPWKLVINTYAQAPQTSSARLSRVEPRDPLWEGSLGTPDSAHLPALSGNPVSTSLPGGRPAAAYMPPVMGNLLPVESSCLTVALLSRSHPLPILGPVLQGLPCKTSSRHGPDGAHDGDLPSAETKAVCASPNYIPTEPPLTLWGINSGSPQVPQDLHYLTRHALSTPRSCSRHPAQRGLNPPRVPRGGSGLLCVCWGGVCVTRSLLPTRPPGAYPGPPGARVRACHNLRVCHANL